MAKKATKKQPWQIEAEEHRREIEENVAMLRDGSNEYLVQIASEALEQYHHAMMRGDKAGRRPYDLVIEACIDVLYRITEHGRSEEHENGGRLWPPRSRSRFDCWISASQWLGEQLAAIPGEVPMHGQPGRFVLTVHGCRTDVRYPGLFGGPGLDGRVIDLDRPFFSETGYRSFMIGGIAHERYFTDEGEMEVDELCRIVMESSLLSDGNGKRLAEPKLHKPPFGLTFHQGKETHRPSPQEMIDSRKGDPAWGKRGFLANLPRLTPSGVAVRMEKSGQFAMAF
ncbi:hypothetical protein C7441_11049 [Pseudaminobacter salicylatoxidans]|uniref:Uncharacterized protein n=1 Tax=Pseudaminobacter salicylatoxidans TaxID=93369 RepID=A0A316C2D9_PSESE|nr:hypothetical protein [Pseudaminobacter salicylatoxidans]PWJ81517.1 hypothetical protein C7441_11049 [Pseudaminobacter salicylatoxidans]